MRRDRANRQRRSRRAVQWVPGSSLARNRIAYRLGLVFRLSSPSRVRTGHYARAAESPVFCTTLCFLVLRRIRLRLRRLILRLLSWCLILRPRIRHRLLHYLLSNETRHLCSIRLLMLLRITFGRSTLVTWRQLVPRQNQGAGCRTCGVMRRRAGCIWTVRTSKDQGEHKWTTRIIFTDITT